MDMIMATNFLAGSALLTMGILIIAAGIVAINNMCARYWKPVKFAVYHTNKELETSDKE